MRTLTRLVWIGLLISPPALATDFDPAEGRCIGGNGDAVISGLLSNLDFVDSTLPNVPPEEQHYLDAEYASAMRVGEEEKRAGDLKATRASAMLDRLIARPLYYVWQVRKAIDPARERLKDVLDVTPARGKGSPRFATYGKNSEAEKLERATRALHAVHTYQLAARDLMNKIGAGPFMTGEQYSRFVGTTYMTSDLASFISCKLAKIMGKQSIPPFGG